MAPPRWKRAVKPAIKAAVAAVVLWAVGRHVARTWGELQARGGSIRLAPGWLALSAALYLAGLTACGMFYGRVLSASATPLATAPAVRAYLVSHLGKYVPGKAMVVVIRVGLSAAAGVRPATAAFATFYETLVMMASGSVLAAVGFALGPPPVQWLPVLSAAGLAVAFSVVVSPRLFPGFAGLASKPFRAVGPDAQPKFTGGLLATGLGLSLLGWLLLGLSQVAVVRGVSPVGVPPRLWLLVAAAVALATVAGFVVAVMPGGLGVREGVLMTVLGPALGDETAVVAALALRLVWVAVEVAAAAALAPLGRAAASARPTPEPTVPAAGHAGAP